MTPGPRAHAALCAQAGPDPWLPGRGPAAVMVTRICGHCPVHNEGPGYALAGAGTWNGVSTGVRGGTTPPERAHLRRQRKADAA